MKFQMEHDKMMFQVQMDGAYEAIVALNTTLEEITQQSAIQVVVFSNKIEFHSTRGLKATTIENKSSKMYSSNF